MITTSAMSNCEKIVLRYAIYLHSMLSLMISLNKGGIMAKFSKWKIIAIRL